MKKLSAEESYRIAKREASKRGVRLDGLFYDSLRFKNPRLASAEEVATYRVNVLIAPAVKAGRPRKDPKPEQTQIRVLKPEEAVRYAMDAQRYADRDTLSRSEYKSIRAAALQAGVILPGPATVKDHFGSWDGVKAFAGATNDYNPTEYRPWAASDIEEAVRFALDAQKFAGQSSMSSVQFAEIQRAAMAAGHVLPSITTVLHHFGSWAKVRELYKIPLPEEPNVNKDIFTRNDAEAAVTFAFSAQVAAGRTKLSGGDYELIRTAAAQDGIRLPCLPIVTKHMGPWREVRQWLTDTYPANPTSPKAPVGLPAL